MRIFVVFQLKPRRNNCKINHAEQFIWIQITYNDRNILYFSQQILINSLNATVQLNLISFAQTGGRDLE